MPPVESFENWAGGTGVITSSWPDCRATTRALSSLTIDHLTPSRYGSRLPDLSLSQKYLLRTRSISDPFFHEARQNGPLPRGFPARPLSPTFLAYGCDTTAVPHSVRYERKLALAVGSLMTTRVFEGAVTFIFAGYCQLTMAFGALARLNENATSWAVIWLPSQNFACGNRSKVNVLPSLLIFQVFAMY